MHRLLLLLLRAAHARYMIGNVPYHRQITPWSCGDASSEMVAAVNCVDEKK